MVMIIMEGASGVDGAVGAPRDQKWTRGKNWRLFSFVKGFAAAVSNSGGKKEEAGV